MLRGCSHRLFDLAGGQLTVDEETAHHGVDFELPQQRITFPAGERFLDVNVQLLDNGVSLKGDTSRSWRPLREATIILAPAPGDESNFNILGDVTTCALKIVDSDKWPGDGERAKDMGDTSIVAYWIYVKQIVRENIEAECWWVAGVVIRGINSAITRNILNGLLLFDIVILQRDLDMAFFVAGGNLAVELLAAELSKTRPV